MNQKRLLFPLFSILLIGVPLRGQASDSGSIPLSPKSQDIISSVRAGNLAQFENTSQASLAEHQRLIKELINVLESTNNPDSADLDKCAAAYYLGELRAPEAVPILAVKIQLLPDMTQVEINHLSATLDYPAMHALVKIGSPSISAMIRNLEESDDVKVRDLSLRVLSNVEGDRDILQLRLKKATEAQKDERKKTRLEAALKSLTGMSVVK